ncbi:MAG: FixG Ig-like domain-containing protein [Pirellulaceae bacterium]
MLSGLAYAVSTKSSFDARIIRGKGAPFTSVQRGLISNTFTLRLVNRSEQAQVYSLRMLQPDKVTIEVIDESGLTLQPGETSLVPLNADSAVA